VKSVALVGLSAVACAGLSVLTGCASPGITPVELPAALRPPAGQTVFFETQAMGVQIYECRAKTNDASAFEWAFRAPEAGLFDNAGKPVGKHYAGPTWEALDLSNVVGEVKARDPGPDAKAIPWLLLSAKTVTGKGVFSETKSILRVRTVGGVAPAQACGESNLKQEARVLYTATYHYYR
jgi:Protein of unknown function (DUF3455)